MAHQRWDEIFERDNGHCRYCGVDMAQSINHWAATTVDHVVARAAGGNDDPSNLVLACNLCNGILSRAKHLTTFEARKIYVTERRKDFENRYEKYYRRPWG